MMTEHDYTVQGECLVMGARWEVVFFLHSNTYTVHLYLGAFLQASSSRLFHHQALIGLVRHHPSVQNRAHKQQLFGQ